LYFQLKVRREGAPEPRKFMGHGICDNIARSAALQVPTDDSKLIFKKCQSLFRQLRVASSDVRGIGIQVSKLTNCALISRTLHDFARSNDSVDNKNPSVEYQSRRPDVNTNVSVLNNDENSELSDNVNSPSGSAPNSFYSIKEPNEISSEPKIKSSLTFKETLDFVSGMHLPPLPRFSPLHVSPPKKELQSVDNEFDDLCLPSLSQLDVSALNALPEEIRLTIQRHYANRDDILNPKEHITVSNVKYKHRNYCLYSTLICYLHNMPSFYISTLTFKRIWLYYKNLDPCLNSSFRDPMTPKIFHFFVVLCIVHIHLIAKSLSGSK
jgi:DNA repair protein REV1